MDNTKIAEPGSDEDLAIEIIARFTGNSRGTPIAKNAFIEGAGWMKKRLAALPTTVGIENGWISVEDGLPEKMQECFVWYVSNMSQPHIRTATYLDNGHFSTSGIQHQNWEVTHWHRKLLPPGQSSQPKESGINKEIKKIVTEILTAVSESINKNESGSDGKNRIIKIVEKYLRRKP